MENRIRYLFNLVHLCGLIPIWMYANDSDHILLTRVVTQPDEAESISIYNPTNGSISLRDYYICDDEDYYKIQCNWNTDNHVCDANVMSPSNAYNGFTAQFPDTSIAPYDTFHIVLNNNYSDKYGEDFVPDLIMYGSDTNSMLETEPGSIAKSTNKIDESSELIILFKWDGDSDHPIEDVDYFLWGQYHQRINKTNIYTYLDDTPADDQLYFDGETKKYNAYSRIGMDEEDDCSICSGGNGIMPYGHDETSENFRQSWEVWGMGCTNSNALNYDPEAIFDDGNCEILISAIHSGTYLNQNVTIQGTIVDYFDIKTVSCSGMGSELITIEDDFHNEVDLSYWDDPVPAWLSEISTCPFGQYTIKASGKVSQYCKPLCEDHQTSIACAGDGGKNKCMWQNDKCIEEVCESHFPNQGDRSQCNADCHCIWNDNDNICEKDCASENNWECSLDRESINQTGYAIESTERNYLSQSEPECSWQIQDPTDVEIIAQQTASTQLVSFQDIINGDYFHQTVRLQGIITGYFDVTPFCGPHALTISDGTTCHSLELTIWDDDWSNGLECLIQPPFLTKEVVLTGFVGEYEGERQLQVCGEITILDENYEYQACEASINSIIDGSQDEKIVSCEGLLVDYFDVTVYDGPHALTIEDAQGYRLELSIWPNTYDIVSSPYAYLLQPPYNRYTLSAMGSVTEYEGEKQLTITGSNSITVTDTITTEGTEYTGLMVTFIIEEEYNDLVNDEGEFEMKESFKTDLAEQLGIDIARISIINVKKGSVILDINISDNVDENNTEPSNDDILNIIPDITEVTMGGVQFEVAMQGIVQLSVNTVIIKPEPYVIIPTRGEKLDYTYSYPKNSRVIIRIYDLSGRFITSLVDEYYEESATVYRVNDQSSWDGRDKLGQIVAPGTYIMHIEAMNPVTGETQTDAAPVVVGVRN